jgi:hypothetical protein
MVAGAVCSCGKAERFCEALFQAPVEIIKRSSRRPPIIDFHGCGSFHSAFPFFVLDRESGRLEAKFFASGSFIDEVRPRGRCKDPRIFAKVDWVIG